MTRYFLFGFVSYKNTGIFFKRIKHDHGVLRMKIDNFPSISVVRNNIFNEVDASVHDVLITSVSEFASKEDYDRFKPNAS